MAPKGRAPGKALSLVRRPRGTTEHSPENTPPRLADLKAVREACAVLRRDRSRLISGITLEPVALESIPLLRDAIGEEFDLEVIPAADPRRAAIRVVRRAPAVDQ